MSLQIKRAVAGDEHLIYDYIVKLADYEKLAHQVTSTPEDIARDLFCATPCAFAEIAYWQGAPCGFALWFYNYSTFHGRHGIYLEDVYVDPKFRGQGIGRALLQYLAGLCVEQGLTRLQWWVLDWNDPAIEFYKSLGAKPMEDWTVFRVTGEALHKLAGSR